MKDEDLTAQIVMAGATGAVDLDAMGAMLGVLGGGPLLRQPRDPATGAQAMGQTLDSDGKPLVAGGVYILNDKRVKVLREEFGAGNAMDTYYRVFYLDSEFRERFVVAEARFVSGPFGRRLYHTQFKPTKKES